MMEKRRQAKLVRAFIGILMAVILVTAAVEMVATSVSGTTASGGGETPFDAKMLEQGANVGKLAPGEKVWYDVVISTPDHKYHQNLTLSMIFTPNTGAGVANVNFTIYTTEELKFWYGGDTSKMHPFGGGGEVSRDGNPLTGERLWSGQLVDNIPYHLMISNPTKHEIDYHIFTYDVSNVELGEPSPPPVAIQAAPGESASTALELTADGPSRGKLSPGKDVWYTFKKVDFDQEYLEETSFTLIFTPDDGNRVHKINFEIFAAGSSNSFGSGMWVSRDDNPVTGERFWNGWVVDGDTYLVRLTNYSDIEVDYWLFQGNVIRTELGEKTEAAVAASPAEPTGRDIGTALQLEQGLTRGSLEAGGEIWYTFKKVAFDNKHQREAAFTLFFTPDDGNRSHKVNFQLYGSDQLNFWMRGNSDQMQNFGDGAWVSRDKDPLTGERVWSGWVLDNQDYFLRIRNDADIKIDYWLFDRNVIRTELGEKAQPVAVVTNGPTGKDPGAPLPLSLGLNEDKLNPHQELWYVFSYESVYQNDRQHLTINMENTPSGGVLQDLVSFEIFGFDQYQIWARGSEMQHFGVGSVVFHDENPETGERTWDGQVFVNTPYFIKVYNHSDEVIDFNLDIVR